jgi:hypothetical protein
MNWGDRSLPMKGPLFVVRKGLEITRLLTGANRTQAQLVAECRSHWAYGWDMRAYGSVLDCDCACYASSADSVASMSPDFPGVSGNLVIGEAVNASFQISRPEPCGYRLRRMATGRSVLSLIGKTPLR